MPMNVSLSQYTVTELCAALDRGDIIVNRAYQRSPRVWPPAARSFLIETILLGYPIPKLYMSQITDVKTRKTRREIVDGQQRTMAIQEFFANKYRLRRRAVPEAAAGKSYEELDEDLQAQFLGYSLTTDSFIGATNEDIREMFRRMNSYTVPLNGEEKRHAEFQGEFKWFIYRESKKYAQAFEDMGTFSEKTLARMADAKLLSEITHAVLKGITTTNATSLRALYRDNDKEFPEAGAMERRLQSALDSLIVMKDLHKSSLMKPNQVYALLLALMHSQATLDRLAPAYTFRNTGASHPNALSNLTLLAQALDDPENADEAFKPFLEASGTGTNVALRRETRFKWMCRAIDDSF